MYCVLNEDIYYFFKDEKRYKLMQEIASSRILLNYSDLAVSNTGTEFLAIKDRNQACLGKTYPSIETCLLTFRINEE